MPYYLYIDTSSTFCEVILFDDEKVISLCRDTIELNHGKIINRFLATVMQEAAIQFNQLAAVCVLNGPGSYTGLRISLSTAKGICYAHDIPLLLINKLDLMQHCFRKQVDSTQATGILIRAREHEYFLSLLNEDGSTGIAPCLVTTDQLLDIQANYPALWGADQAYEIIPFPVITLVSIALDDLIPFCCDLIHAKKIADLFQSEPFYMKDVHINKINKL